MTGARSAFQGDIRAHGSKIRTGNTAYVELEGVSTGGRPLVKALGETNSGLSITSSGSGTIQLLTNGATSLQVEVLHTSLATNALTLTGSAGGNPTVGTSAGDLKLASANGDIQWGTALVALGGGATPTLGTIGGSGPATAAQNSWMRIVDSAGAAFWVPAWK
jgi:hypothetical protein